MESATQSRDFNDSLNNLVIDQRLSYIKEVLNDSFEVLHPLPLQKLSVKDYVTGSNAGQDYLQKWEIIVRNRFIEELDKCVETNKVMNSIAVTYNLPINHFDEMLHHCSITFKKSSTFIGREELISEAIHTIINTNFKDQVSSYSAITAAIIGQSGTGKTAIMATIATLISKEVEDLPIISRYCGTSKFSLHGKDLIHSICLQLLAINGQGEEAQKFLETINTRKYEESVTYFSSLLQRYPLILFIDSVDQLSNKDEARSKLSFLRNLQIHEKSKIIISTLPDEYDETNKQWKYRYLCEKIVRDNQVPVVEMKNHGADENTIRSLLERLLEKRERKITTEQWSVVLNSVRQEPTMLYLNLCLEIITKWRSWERDVDLRPTVKGLINQIFEGLETYYGRTFVNYAFGFISYSREGISDQEMVNCLSRQSEVFQEVCQYWQGVKTIPLHVWLRLKQAITGLLAEKDHACLKWYHRQLWEAAQERYEEVKKDCHRVMGRYFSEQPLCLTELDVWHPDSKINSRRVKEGYYHLYECGLYPETMEEMCNFEMVCASALADDAYHSLSYLSKLHSQLELKDNQKLDHYYRWIRKAITIYTRDPRNKISLTACTEPLISLVKQENTRRMTESKLLDNDNFQYKSMKVVQLLGGKATFDNLVATFSGHRWRILSVAWNPDATKIVSLSGDNTIKIWDSATGELLNTFDGHDNWVTSVSWSCDGTKIASGFQNRTIKIWDSLTGELLRAFDGEGWEVTLLSWKQDGCMLATGSFSCINLWETSTGNLLYTLSGLTADITSVSWHPDGTKIAAGASGGGTVNIWDTTTGELLHSLRGCGIKVFSISWSQNGSQIAAGLSSVIVDHKHSVFAVWDSSSGELFKTVIGYEGKEISSLSVNPEWSRIAVVTGDSFNIELWDPWSGQFLNALQGHKETITSLSWNHDGTQIVSGSKDHTIKIWDVSTQAM